MQCVLVDQDGNILQRASGGERGLRAMADQRGLDIVPVTPAQYDAHPPVELTHHVVNGALVAREATNA